MNARDEISTTLESIAHSLQLMSQAHAVASQAICSALQCSTLLPTSVNMQPIVTKLVTSYEQLTKAYDFFCDTCRHIVMLVEQKNQENNTEDLFSAANASIAQLNECLTILDTCSVSITGQVREKNELFNNAVISAKETVQLEIQTMDTTLKTVELLIEFISDTK